MFAEPSASRGKSRKVSAKEARAGQQPPDASRARGAGPADKSQVQRATKAQRKAGGLRRGGSYEVEDIGELYGRGGDGCGGGSGGRGQRAETESGEEDAAEEDASTSESGSVEGEEGGEREATPAAAPAASLAAADAGRAAREGEGCAEQEDEEVRDIEEGLRAQLRAWAADPTMPMEEQKRCVRKLLAQWHPDKNRHINAVATRVFRFIQDEVGRIVSELSLATDAAAKKEAEVRERQAQRAAEKSARASALDSVRAEKLERKQQGQKAGTAAHAAEQQEQQRPLPQKPRRVAFSQGERGGDGSGDDDEEFSLVVGHGPATTAYLRPWPRSHLTLTPSPVASRSDEVLLFGGEAYDGRELTFYSDLYRVDLRGASAEQPLPWEKVYSSVPLIPGPEARSSHQAFAWDKFLYVFGGEWSSRDQRRYRQFGDLWRIDATGGPGTRWERLEADGCPTPRSGHRMAVTPGGHAVLFGGFSEDRRRRATYLDDLHALHLPTCSWRAVAVLGDRRAARPCARAGGLLWTAGGAAHIFGGTRPKKKGADELVVLEDLWRACMDTASASSGGAACRWERLEVQGEGPGCRSGLCHCAVAPGSPGRRLVFGGVADLRVPTTRTGARGATAEVSVFHQDVFLLDCEAIGGPSWTRLWPRPGSGPAPVPGAVVPPHLAALPPELLAKGGGADAQALAIAQDRTASGPPAPRGRIAACCVAAQGALWVFGGVCESGPRQEVTLDDLWRLELEVEDGSGRVSCGDSWECVLPLSERATIWFDSESEDDEDDEECGPEGDHVQTLVPVSNAGGGVLNKRQQKEEAKKARMEVKRLRQEEKCEEKTSKRDQKKERQRMQARAAAPG